MWPSRSPRGDWSTPRSWILVAWAGAVVTATSLEAQRPISVGLAGGVSIAEGDLGDAVDAGWHALATVGLGALMQPLGLRLDVAYDRFPFDDDLEAALGESGHLSTASATFNATYRLPMTSSPLSPYLISGLGAYRSECSAGPGCDATTRYGWNVGLGTRVYALGFRSFLEARYHRTERGESDVHYFPVTFGILF
jgi:hypothetical protein